MLNERQVTANRENSRPSTGPTSKEAAARLSLYAVIHGVQSRGLLIQDESEEDLMALCHRFHQDFLPSGAMECFLVERLITLAWRLRRVTGADGELFRKPVKRMAEKDGFPRVDLPPIKAPAARCSTNFSLSLASGFKDLDKLKKLIGHPHRRPRITK